MKKIYFLTSLAVLVAAGCQPKVQTEPVDLDAVNDTIVLVLEEFQNALMKMDLDVLTPILADQGLFCGTDPSEIWDKDALIDLWTQMIPDTSFDVGITVNLRKINVASNGMSAIVMEQVTWDNWSPNIPVRQTFHFVKASDDWLIDCIEWGFIAKNEEVEILNKALE